jgi:hypothetical protein
MWLPPLPVGTKVMPLPKMRPCDSEIIPDRGSLSAFIEDVISNKALAFECRE